MGAGHLSSMCLVNMSYLEERDLFEKLIFLPPSLHPSIPLVLHSFIPSSYSYFISLHPSLSFPISPFPSFVPSSLPPSFLSLPLSTCLSPFRRSRYFVVHIVDDGSSQLTKPASKNLNTREKLHRDKFSLRKPQYKGTVFPQLDTPLK